MKRLPIEDLEYIFINTQDIWESFRDKSIFLTGGTGFFGKWLLESFIYLNEKLSLNARLTTLTRDPESFLHAFPFYNDYSNSVRFIKGDILSFDFNLEDKFQYLIHAATSASESLNKENPLLMLDTITIGTRRVLEFAITQPLESFLFISSGAIYGKQPWNISHIKEDDNFRIDINNSKAAYAEGKRIAELYCSTYYEKYNLPLKIARCFAFVGPHLPLDTHFAIGNFIKNVLDGEDIIIKGDGQTIRTYMYASDLVTWLWKILIIGELNNPINVGSNESISIVELAKKIQNFSDVNVHITVEGNHDSNFIDKYVPDTSKAKRMGLDLNIDIDTSILKTMKYNK